MKNNTYQEGIQYAKDVTAGKIVCGKLMILACERFLRDLNDSRFEFRHEKVNHCLKFLNIFKHYTGKSAGKPFTLMPWQVFIVCSLVGMYWAGTDERRFTQSYIQLSRKNGKSFFACAISLYFLLADGEPDSEILVLANSRQQAKDIDFKILSALSNRLDPKGKMMTVFRDSIDVKKVGRLKVLAAESKTGDGYNCSFGLIDEYHEAPDGKMKDLVVSSQGMRQNPHCAIITTAGFDMTKPCYKLREYCSEVLHGIKDDDSLFAAIYELDEGDDWQDEKNWIKSNPCLGVTVTKKYLTEQVNKAKNNPSDEVGVKTKNLNVWCSSAQNWIPDQYLFASFKTRFDADSFPEDTQVYVGVDLSSVSDLSAVSYMIVDREHRKIKFWTDYYLPESALKDNANRELYKSWQRDGYLKITPGNVVDYDVIMNDILKVRQKLYIVGVYYDSYNATQWAVNCSQNGLNLIPYAQSLSSFNKPTKEFERLILNHDILIDKNPISLFCFRNVSLKFDHNMNCKPIKTQKMKKIDGVIAMLQSLGGYLATPQYSNEI